jgi:hypothetical protein
MVGQVNGVDLKFVVICKYKNIEFIGMEKVEL